PKAGSPIKSYKRLWPENRRNKMAFGASGMIASLFVRLHGDAAQLEKTYDEVEKRTEKLGRNLAKIGYRASIAITAPLTAMGIKSVKSFAEFDKAMAETAAVVGNLSKDMRMEMEKTAKTLST